MASIINMTSPVFWPTILTLMFLVAAILFLIWNLRIGQSGGRNIGLDDIRTKWWSKVPTFGVIPEHIEGFTAQANSLREYQQRLENLDQHCSTAQGEMVSGEQIISNRQLCRIGTEGEDTLGDLPNRIRPYIVRSWDFTRVNTSDLVVGSLLQLDGPGAMLPAPNARITGARQFITASRDGSAPLLLSNPGGRKNAFIDLGENAAVLPQGEFTITTLVNPHSIQTWSRIFDMGDGPGTKNLMIGRMGATNHLVFEMQTTPGWSATSGFSAIVENFYEQNRFTHLTIVVRDSINNVRRVELNDNTGTFYGTSVAIYKNGVPQPFRIRFGQLRMITPDPARDRNGYYITRFNYIGRSLFPADAYFDGQIAFFRIFNKGFTEQQVDCIARGDVNELWTLISRNGGWSGGGRPHRRGCVAII